MTRRDRKAKPALNDWHLWSEVTRSVSPLRPEPAPKSKSEPERAVEPDAPRPDDSERNKRRKSVPAAGAPPAYTPAPQPARTPAGRVIEPRLRRRLVRGQLPIDATLDLHGLRQDEAHAALRRFVAARHARGDRTILVITGKGLRRSDGTGQRPGVLRTMLPRWLSEPALAPLIAGWEVSSRAHGGEGAYYVRLKRAGK